MTCILGIDPGLTGALAFFFNGHPRHISVHDMPVVDGQVCGASIAAIIGQIMPDHVFIEQVGARPDERTPQRSFNFGRSYGVLIGAVQTLRIPHTLVVPRKWKRTFALDSDKEKSRALAIATFTEATGHFSRKKDEGRAEAALIALYGYRFLQGQSGQEAA